MKALVTVELQLSGDLLFSLSRLYRIKYKADRLLCTGFVCNNAVVIQITDDGQVQYTLRGVNIRNIRRPLQVRSVCVKVLIPKIPVFVQMLIVSVKFFSADHRQ